MNKRVLILLGIICLVGLFLRTYRLADLPNGLTWDEAALGYNAYSLLQTGKDEHGTAWPLVFKSFGDYKPGAYVYWSLPFIAALDLNSFSTRLPSAIAGVAAIVGLFLLAGQVYQSNRIALLSAFVLAVSPWHIFYSRGAWEVNLFVTLLLFSLYFIMRFLTAKGPLWPGLLLAGVSLYTYQAAKLLTPLVFILVCLLNWGKIRALISQKQFWRTHFPVLLFTALLLGFLGWQNLFSASGNRLTRLSIFNYRPGISETDISIEGPQLAPFFHNRIDQTIRLITSRYLYHFSPEVLFFEGPVQTIRGHIPRMGMLYLLDSFLILAGLIVIIRKRDWLTGGLLLFSPVPAALTLAEFSTTRSLFLVIPISLTIALGLEWLITHLGKWSILFGILYCFNLAYGLDLYFNHAVKVWAHEFNFGQEAAVDTILKYPKSNVIYTDVFGQPYIYYLFYAKYPPAQYQAQDRFIDGGVDVGRVDRIDDIEFRQYSLQDMRLSKNTVFVGAPYNIPDEYLNNADNIESYQQIALEPDKPLLRILKTR